MPEGQPLPPHLDDMGIAACAVASYPVAAPATTIPVMATMTFLQQTVYIPLAVSVTVRVG